MCHGFTREPAARQSNYTSTQKCGIAIQNTSVRRLTGTSRSQKDHIRTKLHTSKPLSTLNDFFDHIGCTRTANIQQHLLVTSTAGRHH